MQTHRHLDVRNAAWAWIMILALLPQMVMKTFHHHDFDVPDLGDAIEYAVAEASCLECQGEQASSVPASATGTPRTAVETLGADDHGCRPHTSSTRRHEKCRHHHNDTQSNGKSAQHHCGICQFLLSPFTPPTHPALSFFVSPSETRHPSATPTLCAAPSERTSLRGPPAA